MGTLEHAAEAAGSVAIGPARCRAFKTLSQVRERLGLPQRAISGDEIDAGMATIDGWGNEARRLHLPTLPPPPSPAHEETQQDKRRAALLWAKIKLESGNVRATKTALEDAEVLGADVREALRNLASGHPVALIGCADAIEAAITRNRNG